MERVLYLEPDEEITSVIDRMKKLEAKNIALVIPRDAVVIQSVVNLKLLKKEALKLKKSISIVTSDRVGKNLAAQVGLSVYDKLDREFLEPEEENLLEEAEKQFEEEKDEEEPKEELSADSELQGEEEKELPKEIEKPKSSQTFLQHLFEN